MHDNTNNLEFVYYLVIIIIQNLTSLMNSLTYTIS